MATPDNMAFLVGDGDRAARLLALARAQNRPDEAARHAEALRRANDLFLLWAQRVGGAGIDASGDEFSLTAPADRLGDVPALMRQYKDLTGCTVSIGVGTKLSEADAAMAAAKKRGGDRAVLYSPAVAEEAQGLAKAEDPSGGASGGPPVPTPVPADLSPTGTPVIPADPPADDSPRQTTLADEIRGLVRGQMIDAARKKKEEEVRGAETRARLMDILRTFQDTDKLRRLVAAEPGIADAFSDLVALLPDVARSLPRAAAADAGVQAVEEGDGGGPQLEKADAEGPGVGGVHLPTNMVKDGKISVLSETGREKWVGARSGLIRNPTTGEAASARHPNG